MKHYYVFFSLITSISRYLFSISNNFKIMFSVDQDGKMSIYFLSLIHCSIPSETIYLFCNVSSICPCSFPIVTVLSKVYIS